MAPLMPYLCKSWPTKMQETSVTTKRNAGSSRTKS
ncbi:unnamed protein product [Leptidea sinapis]|uniref:Uncharacterized protein n=1 Tax=Leptidea sinapis TaxID=189913 RepID=A0A5E4QI53_9NEOP|nr:unnamed protein product [Leptidea sinapis]